MSSTAMLSARAGSPAPPSVFSRAVSSRPASSAVHQAPHLPAATSVSIALQVATLAQRIQHSQISAPAWKGALPTAEAFVRREKALHDTDLTRDGGLTGWVLTDRAGRSLAGCESIRKRGLLARPRAGRDGEEGVEVDIEEVVVHAIGAVYCPPEHRGKGYARRMMDDLGRRLGEWQVGPGQTAASVLYSDIGRDFYARHGWRAHPSTHVTIPISESGPPATFRNDRDLGWARNVVPILAGDVPALAERDEAILRDRLRETAAAGKRSAFALVPDPHTFAWFHAREAFVSGELHGSSGSNAGHGPEILGAAVRSDTGRIRAWCLWTCIWLEEDVATRGQNTLFVLRLVVDRDPAAAGEAAAAPPAGDEEEAMVADLLEAAREHGACWGMGRVDLWSPDEMMVRAAGRVAAAGGARGGGVVERTEESVACMRLYGGAEGGGGPQEVEWVANEKYGWC